MALLKWLSALPWADLLRFIADFLRGRIKWALITCALLIAAAVAAGYYYFSRVRQFEEVVQATLGTELEPTPQYYKGLEAFLVSTLEGSPEDEVKNAEFNAEFVRILEKMRDDLQNIAASQNIATAQVPQVAKPSAAVEKPLVTIRPITLRPSTRNHRVLTDADQTDDERSSFLFVPMQILRPTLTTSEITKLRDPKLSGAVIDAAVDDELRRDVIFTELLLPALRDLSGQGVTKTGPRPEQVYVITKNGVNRIVGSTANTTPYNFPETTFFPMRPYFWPVFDTKDPREARKLDDIAPRSGDTVGKYFKVTRPYMDLGGSGFVITLSRGIRIDGFPMAVLCIDIPIGSKQALLGELRKRVRRFDGYTMLVDCKVGTERAKCSVRKDSPDDRHDTGDPLITNMEATLEEAQQKLRRADVFGNILRLKSPGSTPIYASVPLQAIGDNEGRFLLLALDLGSYRRRVTLVGAFACTAVGLATLLLAYLWGTKVREHRDYENAFSRVADVMAESPTPYVRLTATDHIADFSGSFLELLGFYAHEADQLKALTFESLVAEDSLQKYLDVQESRKAGRPVPSYEIKLKRRDGALETVRIVSAAIPSPETHALPETFGILIQRAGNVVPFDLIAAARRANRASP